MLGLHEVLIFLFSGAEMMLTAVTKVLIVDTLRKQQSLTMLPFPNPRSDMSSLENRSFRPRPFEQHTSTPSAIPPSADENFSPSLLSTVLPLEESHLIIKSQSKLFIPTTLQNSNFLPPENGTAQLTMKDHEQSSVLAKIAEQGHSLANDSQILTSSRTVFNYSKPLTMFPLLHTEAVNMQSRRFSLEKPLIGSNVPSKNRKIGSSDMEKKVSWYLMLDQVCLYMPWVVLGPFCSAWSDRKNMLGLHEVLIFLFSGAEMMLTAVTKVLIVDTLRKQQSLTMLPFPNPRSDMSSLENRSFRPRPFEQHASTPSAIPPSADENFSPSLLSTMLPLEESHLIIKSQSKLFIPTTLQNSNFLPPENGTTQLNTKDREEISILAKGAEQGRSLANDSQILTSSHTMSNYSTLFTKFPLLRSEAVNMQSRRFSLEKPLIGSNVPSKNGKIGSSDMEKKVSWYLMLDQVCLYMPWVVLGPFCGAWSDRHGRKVPLLLPGMFNVLAVLVYLLVALWPGQLLALILVAGLLRGACGKHAMFCTILYSAVADVVPQEQKSARFASILGCNFMGICSGTLGAGLLLEYFSLNCPLLLVSVIQTICFFLVLIALQETIELSQRNCNNRSTNIISKVKSIIVTLWHPDSSEERILLQDEPEENASNNFSVETKRDETGSSSPLFRICIIWALSFLTQWIWSSQREISVQAVSLPPFEWPNSRYSYLFAAIFGVAGITTATLVPCILRLARQGSRGDMYVFVVALLCGGFGCVGSALALMFHSDWQVFVSCCLVAVGLTSTSTCRAMLSKELSPSGQATALAVLYVLENVAKILGPLLHTTIFVATFSLSPSIVFFVMAAEAFLILCMLHKLLT